MLKTKAKFGHLFPVIPLKKGIQRKSGTRNKTSVDLRYPSLSWIPFFKGMTGRGGIGQPCEEDEEVKPSFKRRLKQAQKELAEGKGRTVRTLMEL